MGPVAQRCARGAAPGDRGATSVEFVLLFVFLFLPVCFGTISFGIIFSDKLALTQGAREAARYGATLPWISSTPPTVTPTSFLTEVRQAAIDAAYGQLGPQTPITCVAFRTASGTDHRLANSDTMAQAGTCPGSSGLPTAAHVYVQIDKAGELNLLLNSWTLQVRATSVARYEGIS